MKEINDQDFDALINETVQRQKLLEKVDAQVMQRVKRWKRKECVGEWARLLAFCFGLPLIIILPMASIYYSLNYMAHLTDVIPFAASMIFFIVVILVEANKVLNNFSFK
jgi:hypothetical protein